MAAGDQGALASLYDRHSDRLFAVGVALLRDAARAEDVLHDVLLEAWRAAASFDPGRGSVRTWLLIRMRSRCRDRLRRQNRRKERSLDDAPETGVLHVAGVDHERLLDALSSLPPDQRDAVQACYLQGLTRAEASERLGCPVGTVKTRIRLAMATLRGLLAVEELA